MATGSDRAQDLRVVLLGNVGAAKSASGNTLLGSSCFVSRFSFSAVTQQCAAHTVILGEKRVMVVDTPGLAAEMNSKTAKKKLLQCLQLSNPGPHVFLLVIRLGRFTQEERDTVERLIEVFGKKLYTFTIILFTFKDILKNISIEEYVSNAGGHLKQLVKNCGNRYHAFNNENPGEEDQVGQLILKIDKLVAANGGRWYTNTDSAMEDLEERLKHQNLGGFKERTFLQTPDTMNKIIVYERVDFKGISREFTSSVPNLNQEHFNDCISSLKVIGNPWLAYSDINFKGKQEIYEEGEYARVEHNESISSLEMVTEDLTNPQITLYEHVNYQGRSTVLKNETNLCYGSFNDVVSSHKVQRGAWILYEHADRRGAKMVARVSRDVPNYDWFNDRLSHLRPLKPGRPTITAEVLWDKKEEHVKSVVLDTISGLNYGEQEQNFSTELNKEYVGSVTDSFSFSNATQISLGTKFSVNVSGVEAGRELSLSNTFTVEKGSSNTRTESKGVRISLPTTVPPHTNLTVNVVRKEVDVKVPVKLTITTGSHSMEEYGEYRCECANSIYIEFKEEKI